ncbi:uncharacterized protein [Triticum aestivum]|uniref:uncharacterized protein n=1 Tax=Triticum aestivum TaxID=4565 RepID=UPI001D01044E|nr:uncharacterized protein LOC123132179 [Triticum aestivum]
MTGIWCSRWLMHYMSTTGLRFSIASVMTSSVISSSFREAAALPNSAMPGHPSFYHLEDNQVRGSTLFSEPVCRLSRVAMALKLLYRCTNTTKPRKRTVALKLLVLESMDRCHSNHDHCRGEMECERKPVFRYIFFILP